MPEITENYIRLPVREEGGFQKGSIKTITLDKSKGIKALIGKLKGETSTTIMTLLFPKDSFDTKTAKKWKEEHNLENYYTKQLLYKGTFPHPQHPEQKVRMGEKELTAIANATATYLKNGGRIPVTTPPHPVSPEDKIRQTVGYLKDTVYHDGEVLGLVELNDEASGWIRAGKVRTVSPSVVYGVVTGHGAYDGLIDHVCITPNPHLIAQDKFYPMSAEQYNKAVVFFEGANGYEHVAFSGGDGDSSDNDTLTHKITSLFASFGDKFAEVLTNEVSPHLCYTWSDGTSMIESSVSDPSDTEKEGGSDMELKELEQKNETLQAELKTANATIDDLKKKIEAFETKEKNATLENFKKRIEALIGDGKLEPAQRDKLVASFEAMSAKGIVELKFGDTNLKIEDMLLQPYENRKKGSTTDTTLETKANVIRHGQKKFDVSTPEGKNEFSDHVDAYAKAKNISYEEAREIIVAELESEGGL